MQLGVVVGVVIATMLVIEVSQLDPNVFAVLADVLARQKVRLVEAESQAMVDLQSVLARIEILDFLSFELRLEHERVGVGECIPKSPTLTSES